MSDDTFTDGYPTRPSADEAPDHCQRRGCEALPKVTIRFRDPKEYLCYCKEHGPEMNNRTDAKFCSRLRG